MGFCLVDKHNIAQLQSADEIRINYKNLSNNVELMTQLPHKVYIIDLPPSTTEVDWSFLQKLTQITKIVLCVYDNLEEIKKHNIPFYWGYEITSFLELHKVAALEPAYIKLGPPLCYDLENVKKITSIPLRMNANRGSSEFFPHDNGLFEAWVRPEDLPHYLTYITTFDFIASSPSQEWTLFDIYNKGQWNDKLKYLVKGLQSEAISSKVPSSFGEMRTVCGQKCMKGVNCQFCKVALLLAKT